MKRITALLAAVCLAATLAACGGSATAPTEEPTVPVSSSTADVSTTAPLTDTTDTEAATDPSDTDTVTDGTDSSPLTTEGTIIADTTTEDASPVDTVPSTTTTTRPTAAKPTKPTATTTVPTTTKPTTTKPAATKPSGSNTSTTTATAATTTPTAKPVVTTVTTVTTTTVTTTKPTTTKPTTTRTTEKPLVDVEKKKLNILIIGNSHSVDAFWLLHQAYMDQHPNTELCLGILYYDGASIDEHVAFIDNNKAVMRYYKNTGEKWVIKNGLTSASVLTDRPWDIVMMQPAKEDLADETLNRDGRYALAEAVNRYVTQPHEFVWHVSWPSPNDETFFSPDYMRQPPKGYRDKLIRLYGFNPVTQFSQQTEMTQKWVLDDPLYSQAVCAGSSVMQALLTQGETQLELWRDYTHLSDYGRLLAAYGLTAQLTGVPVTQVGITVIPVKWRHHLLQPQGDQQITAAMRQVIAEAANHSLKDPWNIPPQNYPVPTLPTTTETTTTTTVIEVTTTETTTESTTETATEPVETETTLF